MGRKESRIQSWTSRFLLTIFIILTTQNLISSPVDDHQERFEDVALKIWEYAELGYLEEKSSGLLQQELEDSGFTINLVLQEYPLLLLLNIIMVVRY